MLKINHELLFAPVEIKAQLNHKMPLVAVFTDAAGQKVKLPTIKLLTGTWSDEFVKDPSRKEEVASFLFDEHIDNPAIEALHAKQTQGLRGISLKCMGLAVGLYAGRKSIFGADSTPSPKI